MKNLMKLMVATLLLALAGALLVAPIAAQEDEGEGGVVVVGTFGGGPDTFSPIYCGGTDCSDMVGYMFAGLLGIDPEAEAWAAGVPGALASDMVLGEDGRTYTITIRDDMFWSDGEPITIDDVMYFWEVMTTPEAEYPYPYYTSVYIESVTKIDDSTLEVTLFDAFCGSESIVAVLTPIPEHIFGQYGFDELQEIDYNLNPDVTSGAFQFQEYRPGEITVLVGWDGFVDAELGYVNPDGIIQQVVADQTVLLEQFLAPSGTVNMIEGPPPERKEEIRAAGEAGTHQVYTFTPGTSWDYLGFNMADPTNPQPALDEDGNHIDQGYHPIFTDKAVRQALSHAVNIDSIIEGAVFGEGSRMAAQIVPNSWAHNTDLEPRSYDPETAVALLAEAGWVTENGEAPGPDNPLVCDGCLYATEVDEAFNGSPLQFELMTNAGNTRREAIAVIIQDELAQIGVTVDLNFIDFNTLIDEVFGGQSFDTYILGWRAGYPNDPDTVQLFGAASDDPAAQGSNVTSFYNERYFELEEMALNPAETNNCDAETRAALYHEMQEIMYDEVPYMWLYVQDGMYAARSSVQGFDPYPGLIDWNIDAWAVISE